jgi:hypothetical protein
MAHIIYDGSGKGQARRIRVLGYRFERGASAVYVPDDKTIMVGGRPQSVAKLILAKEGFRPMKPSKPASAAAAAKPKIAKEGNDG